MEKKNLKCSQCDTVADVYLLPSQSIYRCKACGKLSRVVEYVEEEKPKRKRKKKDD